MKFSNVLHHNTFCTSKNWKFLMRPFILLELFFTQKNKAILKTIDQFLLSENSAFKKLIIRQIVSV